MKFKGLEIGNQSEDVCLSGGEGGVEKQRVENGGSRARCVVEAQRPLCQLIIGCFLYDKHGGGDLMMMREALSKVGTDKSRTFVPHSL